MEKLDHKKESKISDSQPDRPLEGKTEENINLKTPMKPGQRPARWQILQSHLDTALHQWNEISTQMEGELSPDQKQLQEVKNLLQQLKTKLEQF